MIKYPEIACTVIVRLRLPFGEVDLVKFGSYAIAIDGIDQCEQVYHIETDADNTGYFEDSKKNVTEEDGS